MVLCAIGALIGLGIAGYGLFTAAGTSTRVVPPENVAMVNQRPILRSDFITQLESETGLKFAESTQADRLKVLDEMIREELLVQRGLELDFAETDQTTRNALVSAISQQITVEVTTSPPTEQQLRQYFDQHQSQYASDGTMLVRNLLVPKGGSRPTPELLASAQQAVTALRAGTPLEQVVARFGLSEAQKFDMDYYFAARYRLGDALFDHVVNLADGAVSDPVDIKDGVHVVVMVKNNRPVPQSFQDSHSQVLTDYKAASETRMLDATLKFLRSRSKILIASDYARDYRP
jgi:parvulin-like peptidyl-prolyl isomerase